MNGNSQREDGLARIRKVAPFLPRGEDNLSKKKAAKNFANNEHGMTRSAEAELGGGSDFLEELT